MSDLPYLVSVESPETAESVPNYYSVNTFTAEQFREKILAEEPEAVLEGSAKGWVTDLPKKQLRPGGVCHGGRRSHPGDAAAEHPGAAVGVLHGGVRGEGHHLPSHRLRARGWYEQ